jgi:Holliday junction DNA helicase RuvB
MNEDSTLLPPPITFGGVESSSGSEKLRIPDMEDLRPRSLGDFSGNSHAVSQIHREIICGKYRGGPRNLLLYGPPGTGKTTLAKIIGGTLGYTVKEINGTSIQTQKQFVGLVIDLYINLKNGQKNLVFIDEIHGISRQRSFNEEDFFLLIERGVVHCPAWVGGVFLVKGEEWQLDEPTMELKPRPVFIGATTDPGLMSKALRDRFQAQVPIAPYTKEDMIKILDRYEEKTGHYISPKAKEALAGVSRLNPRILLSRLDSSVNRAVLSGGVKFGVISILAETVKSEMEELGIAADGLSWRDIKILETLASSPVTKKGTRMGLGLNALAGTINASPTTVSQVDEPFLKQQGYLIVTSRRQITEKGLNRLAVSPLFPTT